MMEKWNEVIQTLCPDLKIHLTMNRGPISKQICIELPPYKDGISDSL